MLKRLSDFSMVWPHSYAGIHVTIRVAKQSWRSDLTSDLKSVTSVAYVPMVTF